ncbi:ribbon-helix-helix domain-containing protein [Rhizobium etli 8C-3]|uniref:Ribbon-helix-helix domain-containing protein n=1 Tax=Rhizobium etli 8C-3 TaxID=538025 RepID=A0A1L5P2A0_RHIET|nr:Arc family DNA-binding protein [Rhizobium etli]APO74289.1 ribbon-helix-helix domain-containing protein [Rhizobium etli 8C-3]
MSKEPKYPSEVAEKFNVRLPSGMRELIRKAAEESGRSMNVEIIHRLQNSFAQQTISVELIDVLKALAGSVVEVKERDGIQEVTFQRPIPVPNRD